MERGDYGALLDAPVRDIVRQAGEEAALAEEIGALRVAVKRLLLEEEDPSKMALGLSRLANSVSRLVKQEREIAKERKGPAQIAKTLELMGMLGGRKEARSARAERTMSPDREPAGRRPEPAGQAAE